MEGMGGVNYFDFEKVFGGTVDFFKGLLAGVRHGLHDGRGGGGRFGDCCAWGCESWFFVYVERAVVP